MYPAVYLEPDEFEATFGQFGGAAGHARRAGDDETRREIIAWQEWQRPLGTLGAGSDALGGWTLDVHHSYDPQARTLYLGDGTTVTTEAIRSQIDTVAGPRPVRLVGDGPRRPRRPTSGSCAASTPARTAASTSPRPSTRRRARVTPDGSLEFLAGTAGRRRGRSATAAPRPQAHLLSPARRRASHQDGTRLHLRHRQRPHPPRRRPTARSAPSRAAATRTTLGDGGPATSASLKRPRGLDARARRHALRGRGRPRPRAPHHARRPHLDGGRRRRPRPRRRRPGRRRGRSSTRPTSRWTPPAPLYVADSRPAPDPPRHRLGHHRHDRR